MYDDLAVLLRSKLPNTTLDISNRNLRCAKIRNQVFVRLAHIQHKDVFLRVQFALQLFHGDLRNAIDDRRSPTALSRATSSGPTSLGRRNAAELLVVD